MAVIPCSSGTPCNCICNCSAQLASDKTATANSFDDATNTFSYTIDFANSTTSVTSIIFCIQCPTSTFKADATNTSVAVTGNPGAVAFTPCCLLLCPINTFCATFVGPPVCGTQGVQVDVIPGPGITSITIDITFTLPSGVTLCYQPGFLRVTSSDGTIDVVNNFCLPGCTCDSPTTCQEFCQIWSREAQLLGDKRNVFVGLGQAIVPNSINLGALTKPQIDQLINMICKLENSTADLNCNIAKVLETLDSNCT